MIFKASCRLMKSFAIVSPPLGIYSAIPQPPSANRAIDHLAFSDRIIVQFLMTKPAVIIIHVGRSQRTLRVSVGMKRHKGKWQSGQILPGKEISGHLRPKTGLRTGIWIVITTMGNIVVHELSSFAMGGDLRRPRLMNRSHIMTTILPLSTSGLSCSSRKALMVFRAVSFHIPPSASVKVIPRSLMRIRNRPSGWSTSWNVR